MGNSKLSSCTIVVHLAAFSELLNSKKSDLETEMGTLFPFLSLGKQGPDLLRKRKNERGEKKKKASL